MINRESTTSCRDAVVRVTGLRSHAKMSGRCRDTRMTCLVFVTTCVFTAVATGEDTTIERSSHERLTAAVKVLPAAVRPVAAAMSAMSAMTPARDAVQPTTPGGKLPQYQLGHLNRSVPEETRVSDPRLRLLLALPEVPMLIEATILIDGKPYLLPREERVQDLLTFAADPEAYRKSKITLRQRAGSLLDQFKDAIKSVKEPNESEEPEDESIDADEVQAADVPEAAEFSAPSSMYQRIERYMASTEDVLSAEEIRWLLTDWVDGPTVLLLNDNYQRFRANQAPVFRILDRDRNQTVSIKELAMAATSFQECDLNNDDLVHYEELADVASDPRYQPTQSGHGKLLFPMPTAVTGSGIYERLAHRYHVTDDEVVVLPRFDANENGKFDPADVEDLQNREPDIKLTVTFDTADPARANIELTAIAAEFISDVSAPADDDAPSSDVPGSAPATWRDPNVVSVRLAGTNVDFSAVQRDISDQISVGAVEDGYPMLPVIDPNDDGRFSIRELRSLNDRLVAFDVNKDGTLTMGEARSTIRVCIGLGPLVHAELSSMRTVSVPGAARAPSGPDWFVRMDRNTDGDLTRREFVGSDEQFTGLDSDSDELISAHEAQVFDAKLKTN